MLSRLIRPGPLAQKELFVGIQNWELQSTQNQSLATELEAGFLGSLCQERLHFARTTSQDRTSEESAATSPEIRTYQELAEASGDEWSAQTVIAKRERPPLVDGFLDPTPSGVHPEVPRFPLPRGSS